MYPHSSKQNKRKTSPKLQVSKRLDTKEVEKKMTPKETARSHQSFKCPKLGHQRSMEKSTSKKIDVLRWTVNLVKHIKRVSKVLLRCRKTKSSFIYPRTKHMQKMRSKKSTFRMCKVHNPWTKHIQKMRSKKSTFWMYKVHNSRTKHMQKMRSKKSTFQMWKSILSAKSTK